MFSEPQLMGLEHRFESQKYLSTPERMELASQLNLSETQVNIQIIKSCTLDTSMLDYVRQLCNIMKRCKFHF